MRIMGLDYGSVTVGVAISDELLLTAQGIETIRRKQENSIVIIYLNMSAYITQRIHNIIHPFSL